ncbi:MAG: elongation factor G [Armatimonadetes bacterium]|nr:elongation factor G [Armatimonadota bacterium]
MKTYSTDKIRNIGLFGHQGAGKTSLAEAMLFLCGAIERQGKTEDGNTTTDFDPDEVDRGMSIFTSQAPCEFQGHKINALDTPGFFDFVAEVVGAFRVIESAVLVASANSGVEVGLEKVWIMAEERKMPRLLFVNKMDKENADFRRVLNECEEKLRGSKVVPLQLPIGSAETFSGIVNLITKTAYKFKDKGEVEAIPIPDDLVDQVESAYESLAEQAAEGSDELLEKYLETMELSDDEIREGLNRRILKGSIVPAFCGSASHLKGIKILMEQILKYVPHPGSIGEVVGTRPGSDEKMTRKPDSSEPFCALVFRTSTDRYVGKLSYMRIDSGTLKPDSPVFNPNRDRDEKIAHLYVMSGKSQNSVTEAVTGDIITVAKLTVTETGDTLCSREKAIQLPTIQFPVPYYMRAVSPKSKGDEDKMSAAMAGVLQEMPTLKIRRDSEIKQTILTGIGDVQIDLVTTRLKRAGVEVALEDPRVPYKETIRSTVKKQGRHKKQTGGRGQFADVWLEISPLPPGSGFEFVDKVVGGVVPKNYIPGVEKGVRKAIVEGVLAGYEVLDLQVALYDGSYHPVDSSDMAFQIAGSMAFKAGVAEARPVLLEPIMDVTVEVPESFMGDVIGDLNSKRGKILGMEPFGQGMQRIRSQVPMAEMMRYAIDLRSITQGRGIFEMKFSHYEDAPPQVTQQVVAAAKAAAEG